MNDSPEIQAKKLIKYGNEKFGLNETTLRGVLDNAKATEDLDAELNEQDGLLNSFEIEINKFPDKGAQKITLEIPSSFGTISSVSSLYYTRINNKVFFSMSSNVGLWVYDIDTDTTEQIFSLGGGWQYFTQVSETKWLITGTGSYATGVALYDSDKNTVRQITTTGASWDTFQQVTDTKWLISGRNSRAKGLLLFNSDNDTISIAFDDSTNFYGWYYFNQIDNDRWFVTAQSSGTTGILLFDARTDTATKIYNSGNRWQYFTQVGEEEWLIRGSNSGNGVVLGDLSTNTFTVLSSTYGCSLTQQISDTEYLVFGNSSGLIFLYDATNKKLTQAYSSGNSSTFNRICKINNDKYLIGSAGSYLGILLYNVQNNTFKQIYTSRSWGIFHQVSEYKHYQAIDFSLKPIINTRTKNK